MEFEPIKKKSNKKRLLFTFLTAIMFIGVSLAAVYFMYQYRDSSENKIKSGLISINFTEGNNVINLTNTVPVIDEVGLENTPYTFTVKNTSQVPINANIKMEINPTTNIDLGAVRYAFYVEDRLITKDYLHDNLILYTYENLERDKEINCKLIFWIDYYYDKPNKIFSAKIIAEGESIDIIANEESSASLNDMCPGCVYAYVEDRWYYGASGTVLTSSDYEENYEDVITASGYPYFLGLILDGSNKISRAFACGVYNNQPFCIEGTTDGSKYLDNKDILDSVFGEYDSGTGIGCQTIGSHYSCSSGSGSFSSASTDTGGYTETDTADGMCVIQTNNRLMCEADGGMGI